MIFYDIQKIDYQIKFHDILITLNLSLKWMVFMHKFQLETPSTSSLRLTEIKSHDVCRGFIQLCANARRVSLVPPQTKSQDAVAVSSFLIFTILKRFQYFISHWFTVTLIHVDPRRITCVDRSNNLSFRFGHNFGVWFVPAWTSSWSSFRNWCNATRAMNVWEERLRRPSVRHWLLAAKEGDPPSSPPSISILTGLKEIDRSRSSRWAGNHGHSCPKEIYGQKKHKTFQTVLSSSNFQGGTRSAAGTGRSDNITRYGQIEKTNQGQGNGAESNTGDMNLKFKEKPVDRP